MKKRWRGRLSVARGGGGVRSPPHPLTDLSTFLLFPQAHPPRPAPARHPPAGAAPSPPATPSSLPPPAPAPWPRWRRSRGRRRPPRSRAARHHRPATARHPTATARRHQDTVSMVCRRRRPLGRTRPTLCPRTWSRRRSGWRRPRRRARGQRWARRARHAHPSRLHRLPAGGTASRRWRRPGWGCRRRPSRSRGRPRSRRLRPPSPCPPCARGGGRMCLVRPPGAT